VPRTELPPAILLMGPTASGKTDLALALADALPCDIISVDSALVYRGMDIGTAKPSPEVLARVPHRLIDICDPSEAYSARASATMRSPRWPRSRPRAASRSWSAAPCSISEPYNRAVAATGE
jgi:hypothetical protein